MHTRSNENEKNISKNKTVMEFDIEHARFTGQKKNTLKHINFVRTKNQACLPFELVGTNDKIPTEC